MTNKVRAIRIGTRGSPLALAQARAIADMVGRAHPGRACEIVPITTRGDRMTRVALWKVGGKGLFVQEIEDALIEGRIDLAVHSMKDMPQDIGQGLSIPGVPKREDVRDVIVTKTAIDDIEQLPFGAAVGTSSLRRRAQLLRIRPDISPVDLRGNVGTRLTKLAGGGCGALIVAEAGLHRLGIVDWPRLFLSPEDFVPAPGQGALAVEVRVGEEGLLEDVDDPSTRCEVFAERSFVAALGASCHSAVGAFARADGDRLVLIGRVLSPDGTKMIEGRREGNPERWEAIGRDMGKDFLDQGAGVLLSEACADDRR